MLIGQILNSLENWAPPPYQESYDNSGLITGDPTWDCTGVLCSLDATYAVVEEAIARNCNLIVAHHPIVFNALKKLTPRSYVEKTVIKAIKNDIAIYAIHTNLDNIQTGVNSRIAHLLLLKNNSLRALSPKTRLISKLYTYVPITAADTLKSALFAAGAGTIGLYEECSFMTRGTGSFRPMKGSNPVIGNAGGERENVEEYRLEIIFPSYLHDKIVRALKEAHPYDVPAYEVIQLENEHQETGSGMIGELPEAMTATQFLHRIKEAFGLSVIKHSPLLGKSVKKVAVCGGAGSFLTSKAIVADADVFITSDIKYHEFFDADGKILLIDIGHWESEQFTIDLIADFLQEKFPTFAVLKTGVNTNPVHYFV